MLVPPNVFATVAYEVGYVTFAVHGILVWLYPPSEVDSYVGSFTWAWALSAIVGGILAALSHLSKSARLVEASALMLMAYSAMVYFAGVISDAGGDPGLYSQATILFSIAVFLTARAISLLVVHNRNKMVSPRVKILEKKLSDANRI